MASYHPSHHYGPEHAATLAARVEHSSSASVKRRRPLSEAQLAANRANAQKSTGPRSPQGKAASSMNAFRHGITGQISVSTEEDRVAHETFIRPIIEDLKPEGALECQLALSIAEGHWRINRIRAMEDNIFALGHYGPAAEIDVEHPELHAALTSARVFLDSSRDLERLTLYEQRIQRGIEKHMREFEALQARHKQEREQALEEVAQLTRLADFHGQADETDALSIPKGFVFSNDEIRARIRKTQLLNAAFHERNHWNPEIEYPNPAEILA